MSLNQFISGNSLDLSVIVFSVRFWDASKRSRAGFAFDWSELQAAGATGAPGARQDSQDKQQAHEQRQKQYYNNLNWILKNNKSKNSN